MPEKKGNKLPTCFYKVFISGATYNHTCRLSNRFFNTASHQSRGVEKVDLNAMSSIVLLLKHNPSTSASLLRPLLSEVMPPTVSLDSNYIRNFRLRVAYFHAANPKYTEISHERAGLLLADSPITQKEHDILIDPITRINFNEMLHKVMAEGSSTWEALAFLRRCKSEMVGFDFRIRLNNKNHPCALMFTTPNGRSNAIRFGDILSLDMQHRQHNNHNWPYFAPVVKDGEMNIGVICESIVISEDIDSYAWVIRKMVEIEPRFKLENIKFIFGDQGITYGLLENLGIQKTCTLRGDYYHLFYQVWPQPHNFGQKIFELISPFLKTMLLSRSKEEYDRCFMLAATALKDDPVKAEILNKINENPSYYAGYYLRDRVGNLNMHGSQGSESNHSSIISHLGQVCSGNSIMNHVCQLVKREAQKMKEKKKADDELYCRIHNYKSKFQGQKGQIEVQARKCLTNYAFKELFSKASRHASYLTYKVQSDGSTKIWPAKCDINSSQTIVIGKGKRCNCIKRVDMDYQCGHELAADERFIPAKYNQKWYNNNFYFVQNPENSPTNALYNSQGDEIDSPDIEGQKESYNPYKDVLECSQDKNAVVGTDSDNTKLSRISYQELIKILSELARTVQHSQQDCISVKSDVCQMIEHYRSKKPFVVNFVTFNAHNQSDNTVSKKIGQPIPASTQVPPNITAMKRKMSSLEYHSKKNMYKHKSSMAIGHDMYNDESYMASMQVIEDIKGCDTRLAQDPISQSSTLTEMSAKDDTSCLPAKKIRSRSCYLCGGKGHGQFNCSHLISYGAKPLNYKDLEQRQELAMNIVDYTAYKTFTRDENDERITMKNFPKKKITCCYLAQEISNPR